MPVDRTDLTYRMMKMLVAQAEQRNTDGMIASTFIASMFDVPHGDVLYLLNHQTQMGRLSAQDIKDPKNTRKTLGRRYRINSEGYRWLHIQKKKRGGQ